MGSVINVNKSAYTEDALIESWSDEFVRQNIRVHRECEELDHRDSSVTERKLSGEVREKIDSAVQNSQIAQQRAISAEAKAGVAVEKAEKSQSDLDLHSNNLNIHTTAEEKEALDARINDAQLTAGEASAKADDAREIAISVDGIAVEAKETADRALQEAGDALSYVTTVLEGKINGAEVVAMTAQERAESAYDLASSAYGYADRKVAESKTTISSISRSDVSFYFPVLYNTEIRTGEIISISFEFGNDVYAEDYTAGISFDSGDTPTAIDYTDSGILNWVGTDCATSDGLSIFQPSANTHYDIVFYFNGVQFIGLVNGFVPATGNEAV